MIAARCGLLTALYGCQKNKTPAMLRFTCNVAGPKVRRYFGHAVGCG
jgi:hypothetical protein